MKRFVRVSVTGGNDGGTEWDEDLGDYVTVPPTALNVNVDDLGGDEVQDEFLNGRLGSMYGLGVLRTEDADDGFEFAARTVSAGLLGRQDEVVVEKLQDAFAELMDRAVPREPTVSLNGEYFA